MEKQRRGSGETKAGSKRTGRPSEGGPAEEKDGVLSRIVKVFSDERSADSKKATSLLKEDHDRVRELFKEYEAVVEGAEGDRKSLVERISEDLEAHAAIEEKIFYQAFRDRDDPDSRKIVRESFEEHLIVKRLLTELAGMEPSDEQFDAKVTVLKENVEHHAKEEERELFPAAEKLLDDEELEDLGRRMSRMKGDLAGGGRIRKSSSRLSSRNVESPA